MTEGYQTDSPVTDGPRSGSTNDLLSQMSTLESPVSDSLPSQDNFVGAPHVEPSSSLPVASVASRKPSAVSYNEPYDLNSIVPLTSVAGFITQIVDDGTEAEDDTRGIASEPSLNFSRKIWWDSLLSLYISPGSNRRQHLTPSERESAVLGITSDIRFLFRESNYWFSFFHISSFFGIYFDPAKRERLQPSLVLAMLAMSTFWQSSELGLGSNGREHALRFRDEAQGALDASFNAGWIDETLAQAAWVSQFLDVCLQV